MELSKLGYNTKWVKFGFLDEAFFNQQLEEYGSEKGLSTAQFRYDAFMKWLSAKNEVTDEELDHFIELAKDDHDQAMAGSATKELFVSSLISDDQFIILKAIMPHFGKWTKKIIWLEDLKRRISSQDINNELFAECLDYKMQYQDSRPLVSFIAKTENVELLSKFENENIGKRIRTMAEKKIRQLKKP